MSEIMPYIAAVIGFLAVWVLNSIKQEIRDIKTSFGALEKDMRQGIGGLERRMIIMETRTDENRRMTGSGS